MFGGPDAERPDNIVIKISDGQGRHGALLLRMPSLLTNRLRWLLLKVWMARSLPRHPGQEPRTDNRPRDNDAELRVFAPLTPSGYPTDHRDG